MDESKDHYFRGFRVFWLPGPCWPCWPCWPIGGELLIPALHWCYATTYQDPRWICACDGAHLGVLGHRTPQKKHCRSYRKRCLKCGFGKIWLHTHDFQTSPKAAINSKNEDDSVWKGLWNVQLLQACQVVWKQGPPKTRSLSSLINRNTARNSAIPRLRQTNSWWLISPYIRAVDG